MNDLDLDLSAIAERSLWLKESALRRSLAFEAVRCQACGVVRALSPLVFPLRGPGPYQFRHDELERESSCHGLLDLAEGPAMNAFWPLPPSFADDNMEGGRVRAASAAKLLIDYETCLLYVPALDRWGFGLTGGGQDLSWEIAGSYVLLGLAPPAELGPLTRMAVRPTAARVLVARAMLISLEAMRLRHAMREEEQRADIEALLEALPKPEGAP